MTANQISAKGIDTVPVKTRRLGRFSRRHWDVMSISMTNALGGQPRPALESRMSSSDNALFHVDDVMKHVAVVASKKYREQLPPSKRRVLVAKRAKALQASASERKNMRKPVVTDLVKAIARGNPKGSDWMTIDKSARQQLSKFQND